MRRPRPRILLATPHPRYDGLESELRVSGHYEVIRLREREALSASNLHAIAPDYVCLPHWSWRIPAEVFESYECIIFHMTDVPFGRGGSPLQNLVLRGIENTCLTALRCVEEMDAGPVYLKSPLSTLGTAEEVFLRASALMFQMIARIVDDRIEPQPQLGEPIVFERRTPEQSNLLQAKTLAEIHDMIRMLDAEGYPRAFVDVGPFRLRFSRASRTANGVVADAVFEYRETENRE